MALFSTFDLWLKQERYDYFVNKFGVDKVLLIDRTFLFAIIHVILPAIFYFVLIWVTLWVSSLISASAIDSFLYIVWVPLSIIMFLIMIYRVGKVYLDYVLDFTIVTPEELISYNQTGILKRRIRTLQTEKIKTATVDKAWFWFSVFNIGNLEFFAEWDQVGWSGEINLTWVKRPEDVKAKVLMIVEIAISMHLWSPHP